MMRLRRASTQSGDAQIRRKSGDESPHSKNSSLFDYVAATVLENLQVGDSRYTYSAGNFHGSRYSGRASFAASASPTIFSVLRVEADGAAELVARGSPASAARSTL